jgi:molybdopterin-biosynthesis enzyme MoeA-like protein
MTPLDCVNAPEMGFMRQARIVIIGNEVLSGDVRDENIHFLAAGLTRLGTRVQSVLVVPDDDQAIVDAIRGGLLNGARVLVTGGIGPTHDDRTRGAVALSLGLPLVSHPEALERLRAGYGPKITPAELSMALLPEGARLIAGQRTGIFGFVVENVYVFPGVPNLLQDIFATVESDFSGSPDHRIEIVTSRKEGDFAVELSALQDACPDVEIGSYPIRAEGGWMVRLILKGRDRERVEQAANRARRLIGVPDPGPEKS